MLKKLNCIDCHFLAFYRISSSNPGANLLGKDLREKAWQNDFEFVDSKKKAPTSPCLGCYKEIWMRRAERSIQSYKTEVNKTNRRGKCFFTKFEPDMSLSAAVELSDKQQQDSRFRSTRWIAFLALIISGVSLIHSLGIFNMIVQLVITQMSLP